MQLICPLQALFFKPIEIKNRKNRKDLYACPCYVCPNRAIDNAKPSFVVYLQTGPMSSDHYIKRGTALLMSLDNWLFCN